MKNLLTIARSGVARPARSASGRSLDRSPRSFARRSLISMGVALAAAFSISSTRAQSQEIVIDSVIAGDFVVESGARVILVDGGRVEGTISTGPQGAPGATVVLAGGTAES
ncbi:MAG TPA: hypothetical protein VK116_20495, partial [Planctomycetota bacterium]|nr:hypothetical protein [Planctomycetota bacterium]